jgi:hypothetical protein
MSSHKKNWKESLATWLKNNKGELSLFFLFSLFIMSMTPSKQAAIHAYRSLLKTQREVFGGKTIFFDFLTL